MIRGVGFPSSSDGDTEPFCRFIDRSGCLPTNLKGLISVAAEVVAATYKEDLDWWVEVVNHRRYC